MATNSYSRYNNKRQSGNTGSKSSGSRRSSGSRNGNYNKSKKKDYEVDPLKVTGYISENDSDTKNAPDYRGLLILYPELLEKMMKEGVNEEYGNFAIGVGIWVKRDDDGNKYLSLSGSFYVPEEGNGKSAKKTKSTKRTKVEEDEDDDDEDDDDEDDEL